MTVGLAAVEAGFGRVAPDARDEGSTARGLAELVPRQLLDVWRSDTCAVAAWFGRAPPDARHEGSAASDRAVGE